MKLKKSGYLIIYEARGFWVIKAKESMEGVISVMWLRAEIERPLEDFEEFEDA